MTAGPSAPATGHPGLSRSGRVECAAGGLRAAVIPVSTGACCEEPCAGSPSLPCSSYAGDASKSGSRSVRCSVATAACPGEPSARSSVLSCSVGGHCHRPAPTHHNCYKLLHLRRYFAWPPIPLPSCATGHGCSSLMSLWGRPLGTNHIGVAGPQEL